MTQILNQTIIIMPLRKEEKFIPKITPQAELKNLKRVNNQGDLVKISKIKRAVWERDKYICYYCHKPMKELYFQWKAGLIRRKDAQLTIDHIKPLSKGGTWEWENLVTACFDCNLLKGNIYDSKKSVSVRSKTLVYRLLDVLALWVKWAAERWLRDSSYPRQDKR